MKTNNRIDYKKLAILSTGFTGQPAYDAASKGANLPTLEAALENRKLNLLRLFMEGIQPTQSTTLSK